jgi:arginyl-tRNA synthetase
MKKLIVDLLHKHIKLKKENIKSLIEIPPSPELGDYAFPCFLLAKKQKRNPVDISTELARKIKTTKQISGIKAAGPYLNFFIDKKALAKNILKKILKREKPKKKKSKGMIEFSQANTHKAFHIGHIRGTSLGESLARIAEFCGEKVIRANYQGDTGMHVAKWLWCYQKYHKKEKLKKDESWIASIYVDAVKRLKENEKLQEEVDEINRKLELGKDKKLNALWKKTRKISLESLEKIYKELNTKFDKYYFESQLEKRGKEISEQLLKNKIAKKSEGAIIMDLKKYNLGIWVLLRKDQTVLYSAKDLALAEKKFENDLDWSIYVVGAEQKLHFQQLIKTLELMKFKKLKDIRIIHFDLVRLPTGKMSSRTGENILYSDFISEVKDYAKKEIKKRFSKIKKTELEKRALAIAIASIKYSMLKQDPNKLIVFLKEEALNFEGNSGPYLLYSYARASSIMKKAKKKPSLKVIELKEQEISLIKKLSQFPEVVEEAHEKFSPTTLLT